VAFDTLEARKVITSLEAHQRHPGGDLMLKASVLLKDAVADAGNAMNLIRVAEGEAIGAKRRLETELLEMKRIREELALSVKSIEVLQQVAETKKGASNIAREYLVSIGKMPPSPPAKPEGVH